MKIFKDLGATEYRNPKKNLSTRDIAVDIDTLSFAPFEILGESVVPKNNDVPFILQGIFIQATNLDVEQERLLYLGYVPTQPFKYGPTSDNIILDANYIDASLTVFDYTEDFKAFNSLLITVPPRQTIIAGVQYLFAPPAAEAGVSAPVNMGPEALGNRGYVLVLATGAGFLVTATIRQVFLKSFNDKTVLSSTAYSVPLSNGPIVKVTAATERLLS